MSELDINFLLKAVDNENHAHLLNLTNKIIHKQKNDILQKLQLKRDLLKSFHKKLKNYRFVSELHEVQYGAYIRWINLKKQNDIKLTNGGIICDICVNDNGLWIKCKNNMNRFFQLNFEECIVFQKINDQERILLSVLDFLDKDDNESNDSSDSDDAEYSDNSNSDSDSDNE